MNDKVRIVSGGLVLLAMACVGLNVVGSHYLATQRDESTFRRNAQLQLPVYVQSSSSGQKEIQALPQPLETNYEAQRQIKQQCGGSCVNPASQTFAQVAWGRPYGGDIYPGKVLPDGSVVDSVGPSRTVPSAQPTLRPAVKPEAPKPAQADVRNRPEPKKYQLLLFLDSSLAGQQLASWFGVSGNSPDPQLAAVRNASSFQSFTADNKLYQSRYANIVAPDQFPALVLQDATGGHIHACGKLTIPNTPDQLYDDLRTGYELYTQAKQGTPDTKSESSGAMKGEGYNFADFVDPKLRLIQDDNCPDGICPVDPPGWRPGDKVRDVADKLFPNRRKPDGIEGLFISWVSGPERIATLVTYVLIGLIVFVAYLKWQRAKSSE